MPLSVPTCYKFTLTMTSRTNTTCSLVRSTEHSSVNDETVLGLAVFPTYVLRSESRGATGSGFSCSTLLGFIQSSCFECWLLVDTNFLSILLQFQDNESETDKRNKKESQTDHTHIPQKYTTPHVLAHKPVTKISDEPVP